MVFLPLGNNLEVRWKGELVTHVEEVLKGFIIKKQMHNILAGHLAISSSSFGFLNQYIFF